MFYAVGLFSNMSINETKFALLMFVSTMQKYKDFLLSSRMKNVFLDNTTEKNITNTLTLVPVSMQVGFEGPRHVLLY